MTRANNWTRSETLAALHLYLQLPYGQLHRRQPRIVQLSQWLGRTANAVALKWPRHPLRAGSHKQGRRTMDLAWDQFHRPAARR